MDQSKQIRAFQLGTATADQNDQAVVRRLSRQREKVVSVTSYHHTPILLGGGENHLISGISRQQVCHLCDFVTVAPERFLDRGGNVVVQEKLHFSVCSI